MMRKMMAVSGLLLVTVSCLTPPCTAQSKRLRYTEGDWISYTDFRYVTSISVGHQYVYFGTTGGITRYDRYLERWLTPYTTSNGLSDDRVERVAFDPATQYLWCRTGDGFTHYYQPTEKQWHIAGYSPPPGLFRDPPRVVYPDFFTDFEYTFFADGYEASIQDRDLRSYPVIQSVTDDWNTMWIATWGLNVGKGDLDSQKLQMLRFGLTEPNVAAMAFDGQSLWLAGIGELQGSRGVTRFDRKRDEWTYYEARFIDGFNRDNVTSIAAHDTYVWFGTYDGLVQLNRKKESWKTFTISDGLSENEVLELCRDGDTLWIGTGFGLTMFDSQTQTFQRVADENIATSIVYDIEIHDGTLWAATNHGLYYRTAGQSTWDLFIDREDHLGGIVADMAVDTESVWFVAIPSWAAEERLFLRTEAHLLHTGRPRVPGSQSLPISLFLSRLRTETGQWEQYFPPGTFSFGTINGLAVNDSVAWIATDEGALKYDCRRDRWRRFTEEDGLLDNTVQRVMLDGDHVWFGTPRGVTRFYWNDPYRID